jgi:hypothetical protein
VVLQNIGEVAEIEALGKDSFWIMEDVFSRILLGIAPR